MVELLPNRDDIDKKPSHVRQSWTPPEPEPPTRIDLVHQEFAQLLTDLGLSARDTKIKVFQTVLRRGFVGFEVHSFPREDDKASKTAYAGEVNVAASERKLRQIQKDSEVLDKKAKAKIVDWIVRKIQADPANARSIYNLFWE